MLSKEARRGRQGPGLSQQWGLVLGQVGCRASRRSLRTRPESQGGRAPKGSSGLGGLEWRASRGREFGAHPAAVGAGPQRHGRITGPTTSALTGCTPATCEHYENSSRG